MTMRPSDNWRWYFDNQYDCLMLEIANDMVFRSRYPSKMLTPDAFRAFPFSVDDASAYYQFYESCVSLSLSEPQKVELVLNAIIAANFLKPQMPKSWYFVQQPMLFTPVLGELVEAQIQGGHQRINLLVVEASEMASLCLIAEPNVNMAGKSFTIAEVVKVMNDRLASKNHQIVNDNDDDGGDEEAVMDLLYQVCS
ncbi:cell division protein ZapC domain-containing protein [Orbus hercynius]|uniref:cell division protein ZapC domain-containing protein n=1 Tax=Orbus hercynius TaxID=593135 RepID=UPI000EAD68C9